MKKKSSLKKVKKSVVKHLKGDIKMFKKEAQEDRELIKKVKKSNSSPISKKSAKKAAKKKKIEKVMHEFKEGELHSGSKKGPKVTNKRQAVAIALSEARKSAKGSKKKSK